MLLVFYAKSQWKVGFLQSLCLYFDENNGGNYNYDDGDNNNDNDNYDGDNNDDDGDDNDKMVVMGRISLDSHLSEDLTIVRVGSAAIHGDQ
ncbi:hypothetical protein RhiirB3_453445 [Rhizophagus irregularis]|nr:hypothetical protein RhiirB3_453445 [Rhizophagus irregularis]